MVPLEDTFLFRDLPKRYRIPLLAFYAVFIAVATIYFIEVELGVRSLLGIAFFACLFVNLFLILEVSNYRKKKAIKQ